MRLSNRGKSISKLTDEEIELCACALEHDSKTSYSVESFKLDEVMAAAMLRDYIRLRKRDRILVPLLNVDLSKSLAPYRQLNSWGWGKHHKDCGCNFYGTATGYEIAEFLIKNKVKEYRSVEAAEQELEKRVDIFDAIMTGMNALVTAQEENRRLMAEE